MSAVHLRNEHRRALRKHALELLKHGHRNLDHATFAAAEEEEITGRLKEAIERFIESAPDSPAWVERYTIYDEEKPSHSGKLGSRRPRIDITIKRRWRLREAHPRFRFEAKRLRADNRVTPYFGKEGLGCFLRGVYPLTHPEAGMIGYVQHASAAIWQERLGKYAARKARALRIVERWQDYPCVLANTSTSAHEHPVFGRLSVVHVLLPFC
jgi:hypothetical protein